MGSGEGASKKKGENQLLYKIKYINPAVTSGNNQLAAKKKRTAPARDAKGMPSAGSSRLRPPTAGARGKGLNSNHAQSQNDEDGHPNSSRQPTKTQEESQSQRLRTEVRYADDENAKARPTSQHGQAELLGWSRNFNGAMEQQSIVVQKRTRHVKFGGSNCMLEPRIVMTILEYDMTNFRKFLSLSPNWHHMALEGLNERLNKVEVDFVNKYYEHLFFKKSYTNSSIMYFGGKRGIRVDRILVCEILDQRESLSPLQKSPANYHLNNCLKASFKYKFTTGSQNMGGNFNRQQGGVQGGMNVKKPRRAPTQYCADYKMDIVKADQPRVLWMHKDEQEQQ